ncbi:unnamed protein product [Caenorhabditis nigoni]
MIGITFFLYDSDVLMIGITSMIGITFSILEQFAKPSIHNFNKALVLFTFGWQGVPNDVMLISLILCVGFYVLVVSFLAVQFVYRYVTLTSPSLCKNFESSTGIVVWSMYPLVIGTLNGLSLFTFAYPDDFGDAYLRTEMFRVYNTEITALPRLLIIPWDTKNHIRWSNTLFLLIASFLLSSQYLVIVYCTIKINFKIEQELQKFSILNRKLQKQVFKALVIQIIVPTLLFVLPSTPVILTPLLNIEISIETTGILAPFSLYPSIDSLVFMVIVSEYRKIFWKTKVNSVQNNSMQLTVN